MWWILLLGSALAGELVVDARVPAEVFLDGQPAARLYRPSVLHLPAEPGTRPVTVMVGGRPHHLDVEIPTTGAATLLIGRSGITAGSREDAQAIGAGGTIAFRVAGREGVLLQLGDARHPIGAGQVLELSLPGGEHRVSVRDPSGTVVWARGVLLVGDEPLVVQLSEGRMPEVSGRGGAFRPDTR